MTHADLQARPDDVATGNGVSERPGNYVALLAGATSGPLHERLELLAAAGIGDTITAADPQDAIRQARAVPRTTGLYLLDLNATTTPVLAWAILSRRSVVLDFGDDAYSLARASGVGMLSSLVRGLVDAQARRFAPRIVHRGRLHPVIRPIAGSSVWCPDTVPDWVLELPLPDGDPDTIATFGTMLAPDGTGWTYGMELIETLRRRHDLRGIVVGRGPGLAAFKAASGERSLRGRLAVHDAMPLRDLVECFSTARFLTSFQSNDRAGWVRTTGKLPLVLGSGRVLLSSDVGEAALTLPRQWRLPNDGPWNLAAAIGARVDALRGEYVGGTARELAEPFRRSNVATTLRAFLSGHQAPRSREPAGSAGRKPDPWR